MNSCYRYHTTTEAYWSSPFFTNYRPVFQPVAPSNRTGQLRTAKRLTRARRRRGPPHHQRDFHLDMPRGKIVTVDGIKEHLGASPTHFQDRLMDRGQGGASLRC